MLTTASYVSLSRFKLIQSTPSLPSFFFKIHFNIRLPSKTRSSRQPLSFVLPCHKLVCNFLLPRTCHMPRSSHPANSIWCVQTMKRLICSFLQPSVTSSLTGPNVFLSNIFSLALSQYERPVFTPYSTSVVARNLQTPCTYQTKQMGMM